jgi:hypothetical protein
MFGCLCLYCGLIFKPKSAGRRRKHSLGAARSLHRRKKEGGKREEGGMVNVMGGRDY